MNKKFFKAIGLLLAVFSFCLMSCSTLTPVASDAHYPADGSKYVILGRVTLEAETTAIGYTKLLEKAKSLYPKADDVVNIVVDVKVKTAFWLKSYKYIISGIAIDYVEVK